MVLPRVGWMVAWWVDSMVARMAALKGESTAGQRGSKWAVRRVD